MTSPCWCLQDGRFVPSECCCSASPLCAAGGAHSLTLLCLTATCRHHDRCAAGPELTGASESPVSRRNVRHVQGRLWWMH